MRPGPNKTAIIIDAVGNCFRHGVPETPHEWSLEGVTKRKKGESSTVGIRYCPSCYGALSPVPVCPYCGHEFVMTARQLAVSKKKAALKEQPSSG